MRITRVVAAGPGQAGGAGQDQSPDQETPSNRRRTSRRRQICRTPSRSTARRPVASTVRGALDTPTFGGIRLLYSCYSLILLFEVTHHGKRAGSTSGILANRDGLPGLRVGAHDGLQAGVLIGRMSEAGAADVASPDDLRASPGLTRGPSPPELIRRCAYRRDARIIRRALVQRRWRASSAQEGVRCIFPMAT